MSTAITKQLQTSSAVLLEPMMDVEALASPAPRTGGPYARMCEHTHACVCVCTRANLCQRARVWVGLYRDGARKRGGFGDMGPSAAPQRAVAQVAAGGEKIGVVVADFTGNRQGSVASLEASHAHVRPHMTCVRARMHIDR